ncbi:inositol monophosphatase/fructose-1,6-bisphosphatase family protein [Corynebacterium uterequi]|uniref:Inositol monophosphatase/fructose-1,6-bisphosphatase family protein n=2 Tax=Corynebacterium uterequi TaxID=1072256 RepID=A0A0G3HDG0_9CORY|nr:inositol monophosphatase/fructose-1,6-bisphosphatase family protein [Corynebacterium uterequi]
MLGIAEEAVDEAEAMFVAGLGADPAELKRAGDFATEVDLEIEATIRSVLTRRTAIPVLGEEEGGSYHSDAVWVVDPIDGTANYAAGNPLCAILVSLVIDGRPVVAVSAMPLLNRRLTTVDGESVLVNGRSLDGLADRDELVTQVGLSSIASSTRDYPTSLRQELLARVARTRLRPRITGAVGVDLALTAQGVSDGTVSFSPHLWDNAAGVAHVRAAGGVVTDLDGAEWTPDSRGVIAGTPGAHATLFGILQDLR